MPIILIQLYRMSNCIQHLANKLVCGKYFIVQYFVKTSINFCSWPIQWTPLESFRLPVIIIFHTYAITFLKYLDFRLISINLPQTYSHHYTIVLYF